MTTSTKEHISQLRTLALAYVALWMYLYFERSWNPFLALLLVVAIIFLVTLVPAVF